MNLPQRKLQRFKNYDYSQNNAYFITVCTQNRLNLFGNIIDRSVMLNSAGKMVAERLLNISDVGGVTIDNYVVMPNHIHAIIIISHCETTQGSDGTTQGSFPTVSTLIRRFKTIVTKLYIDGVKNGLYPPFEKKIWQKSFYDHIIRNENEYQKIWQYIDENPARWTEDEYYKQIYVF